MPSSIFAVGDIERDPRADRRQNVVDVDPPHERRAHFDFSRGRLRREFQAAESSSVEFLRGQIGARPSTHRSACAAPSPPAAPRTDRQR